MVKVMHFWHMGQWKNMRDSTHREIGEGKEERERERERENLGY